ncbi:hypothetical protein R6Z07M_000733 [Ovis aries]
MRSVRTCLSPGRSLVLAVLLVDSLGKDLLFHPEWGFDSYEITVPKKLSFHGGEQRAARHVSYLLQVKGKNRVLHLWPKRFLLPRNLQVFSFTEQGSLLEDHPYVPKDCNYMGLVEGNPDSEATISTCMGGLRGILKIAANHYQIEPRKASSNFEHMVYPLEKEEEIPNQICGLTDDETVEQMAQRENMARSPDFTESYVHQKYLELALVFDNSRSLVLAVLLVDSLGKDLLFHPEWSFDSYEITIPKKLSFRGGEQRAARHVSYLLQVKGKNRVLHLWPKRFLLPRNLQVFSFTEQGRLLEDHPYIPNDCNYMGLVEGNPDSEVTISTCMGGLQGILKIDANYYQIEPRKASSNFEHVVYLMKKEEEFPNQICGLTDDETVEQMAQHENIARTPDFTDLYRHQMYMEVALVFDNSRSLVLAVLLVDSLGKDLLFHPEWSFDSYEITIPKKLSFRGGEQRAARHVSYLLQVKGKNRVLHLWPKRFLLPRNLQVFSFTEQGRLLEDHPYVPKDCNYMGLVEGNPDSEVTISTCMGGLRGILKIAANHYQIEPRKASSHFEHVVYLLEKEEEFPSDFCGLTNDETVEQMAQHENMALIPEFTNSYMHQKYLELALVFDNSLGYVVKRCGNKIVEENEECDCGSGEECEEDWCCRPDCKFKEGASCSAGLCCHNCRFRPSGYMCRVEENECDLAEYCNGTSAFCPSDTYKQDGTPCKYRSRCVRKGCRSRTMQCQNIFGANALGAPHQCYDAVNVIGDQYGNCGILGVHKYEQCPKERSLCGRLQCINVETLPQMPDHTILISTHLHEENLMCWGIGYHLAMVPMGLPDLGMINDGTSCGKERVCFNRKCVNSSVLNFDCFPEKCNHRGVCNSNRNCHCLYGWAPPLCEEVGYGGSIDSGPPGPLRKNMPISLQVVILILMRLIFLIISVIVVFYRKIIGI